MNQDAVKLVERTWEACPECRPEGMRIHHEYGCYVTVGESLPDSIAELAIIGAMVTWLAEHASYRESVVSIRVGEWNGGKAIVYAAGPEVFGQSVLKALCHAILAAKGQTP